MTEPEPIEALLAAATAGDRAALARTLTLVEGGGTEADNALQHLIGAGKSACIVGITGAPGAGKSTLVGALIRELRTQDQRVAVLAVDPSSPVSAGALLGDRLRMTSDGRDPGVFIRSMASRGQQGGLASASLAAAVTLEACGWPLIILETVGAGQVEVDIADTADITVVVVNPGWGDEVQTQKAGLMEIGDIFVINKADRAGTAETRRDLEGLLSARGTNGRPASIVETVATDDQGIGELLARISDHQRKLGPEGPNHRRTVRIAQILRLAIQRRLDEHRDTLMNGDAFRAAVDHIAGGNGTFTGAVNELLSEE